MNFNAEQDLIIVEAYTPPHRLGIVRRLCQQWNCKSHQIKKRALSLGCSLIKPTTKVGFWTVSEIELLLANPTLTHQQLEAVFAKNGYKRTWRAIDIKRRKVGWLGSVERDSEDVGYYPNEIARLLGTDHKSVARWIKQGKLVAKQYPGDNHHRVQRKALRDFLTDYIGHWEPGNADKYWLVHLLAGR